MLLVNKQQQQQLREAKVISRGRQWLPVTIRHQSLLETSLLKQ